MIPSLRVANLGLIFIITLGLFASQVPALMVLAVIFLLTVNIKGFVEIRAGRFNVLLALLVMLVVMPSFFDISHGFSSVFYFFGSVICLVSAKYIADRYSLYDIYAAVRLLFVLFTLFLSFFLYKYWGFKEPFGEIVTGSSTNGFPSYFIVVQIVLSSLSYLVFRKVNLLFAAITFGVAFFGNGRGSLVIAIGILVFSAYVNIFLSANSRSLSRTVFAIIFSVVPVIFVSLIVMQFWNELIMLTKLSVGLVDENRLEILSIYLENLDAFGAIFGGSYSGTLIASEYSGNPHISFIRTHYLFGLLPMLAYIVSPVLIIFLVRDRKAKFVLLGFITLVWLRVLSEPILFPTVLDFFYFLIFFSALRYDREFNKYSA